MFYTLHRLVKWSVVLVALAGLYWLYLQREALAPLWVWYDVYENGGIERTEPLPAIRGEGLNVIDGHTFQMKSHGAIYSVRLTGFDQPAPPVSPKEAKLEKERREVLHKFVIGKPVQVDVTYSNLNSVLGIIEAGGTNLNIYYVANGLSHFNREYVKTVPRDLQYRFFSAAHAREKKQVLAMRSE
jgi:hypothetical protein